MVKIGDTIILVETQESYDNYAKIAGECNELRLRIREIERTDTYRKFEIYNPRTTKTDYEEQINNHKLWFDEKYGYQEQKYRRLIAINQPCDDGTDPNEKLISLYKEAETRRKDIQRLELLIEEYNKKGE